MRSWLLMGGRNQLRSGGVATDPPPGQRRQKKHLTRWSWRLARSLPFAFFVVVLVGESFRRSTASGRQSIAVVALVAAAGFGLVPLVELLEIAVIAQRQMRLRRLKPGQPVFVGRWDQSLQPHLPKHGAARFTSWFSLQIGPQGIELLRGWFRIQPFVELGWEQIRAAEVSNDCLDIETDLGSLRFSLSRSSVARGSGDPVALANAATLITDRLQPR